MTRSHGYVSVRLPLVNDPHGCNTDPTGEHGRACPDPRQFSSEGGCRVKGPEDDPDRSEHCPAGQAFYSQLGCSAPCPGGGTLSNGQCHYGVGGGSTRPPGQQNNQQAVQSAPVLSVSGATVNESSRSAYFTVRVVAGVLRCRGSACSDCGWHSLSGHRLQGSGPCGDDPAALHHRASGCTDH